MCSADPPALSPGGFCFVQLPRERGDLGHDAAGGGGQTAPTLGGMGGGGGREGAALRCNRPGAGLQRGPPAAGDAIDHSRRARRAGRGWPVRTKPGLWSADSGGSR